MLENGSVVLAWTSHVASVTGTGAVVLTPRLSAVAVRCRKCDWDEPRNRKLQNGPEQY